MIEKTALFGGALVGIYLVVMELGRRDGKHDANQQLRAKADAERKDRVRPDYVRKMEIERWTFSRKMRQIRAGLYVEAKRTK